MSAPPESSLPPASGLPRAPVPLWRRVLRVLWLVVVLVTLALVLRRRGSGVLDALGDVSAWSLAGAALAVTAGVGASAQVWRGILGGMGVHLPWRAGARVFFVGQLGKYLPGSVWPLVAQMELGRDYGVGRRVSVGALGLFMVVHLLSAGIVAAIALPVAGLVAWPWLLAAPPLLALLLPRPLGSALRLAFRVLRRPAPALPGGRALAVALGWALCMWALYGLHLWLLARDAGADLGLLGAVGAFALAWAAGFLFVVAPVGAGAREAVLVGIAAGTGGTGVLLAVALLSRALSTVADALWGVAALAVRRSS
ncbi:MAG TPA: lysylphosphatidylglycerol synthase domain-containing protein [Egibacteraceae bacterium]|nr:lysylphosphatidylglycerol synthase domain-containing protein [Egibacteraceae bacterium]